VVNDTLRIDSTENQSQRIKS